MGGAHQSLHACATIEVGVAILFPPVSDLPRGSKIVVTLSCFFLLALLFFFLVCTPASVGQGFCSSLEDLARFQFTQRTVCGGEVMLRAPMRATIGLLRYTFFWRKCFLNDAGSLTQNRRKIRPLNFCAVLVVYPGQIMGCFVWYSSFIFLSYQSDFGERSQAPKLRNPPGNTTIGAPLSSSSEGPHNNNKKTVAISLYRSMYNYCVCNGFLSFIYVCAPLLTDKTGEYYIVASHAALPSP